MKCIRCDTDNNLKDRTANVGRCKACSHSFAFEPTAMPTDAKIAFDGTFELPSQAPGPVQLEVVDENLLRPREPHPTVVAAGATDVVLVFDTGSDLSIRISNRAKQSASVRVITYFKSATILIG